MCVPMKKRKANVSIHHHAILHIVKRIKQKRENYVS